MAMFQNCTALQIADFPVTKTCNYVAFKGCSSLKALVLRNAETVADSGSTLSPVENTPIASGNGYVYVPAALVADYKASNPWKAYSSKIRALEDYTVDGTTTGALDETKI